MRTGLPEDDDDDSDDLHVSGTRARVVMILAAVVLFAGVIAAIITLWNRSVPERDGGNNP